MNIDFIENRGPDNIRDILNAKFPQCREVCIAVAFITAAGVNKLIQPLRQVAKNGRVFILTGLYHYVTEPQALRALLRVQIQMQGNLSVRLSREAGFHQKLYLLNERDRTTIIIGSSNLTAERLQSGGELNLMLSLPKTDPKTKQLMKVFQNNWERAIPLTREHVARYDRFRPTPARPPKSGRGLLRRILGTKPSHTRATQDSIGQLRYWVQPIGRFVSKSTDQIISEATNWKDQNYSWFGTNGPHSYRCHDLIFVFHGPDKQLGMAEVVDIARTKVSTPDGRHFVAYKTMPRMNRPIDRSLWTELNRLGIYKADLQDRGRFRIGSARAGKLKTILCQK